MQYTNLPIVSFLALPLGLFLLHLLFESTSGILVFGLGFGVSQPELIGYAVCLFLCPFLCCTRFVDGVFLSQPLQALQCSVPAHVCVLLAQVIHAIVG